MPPIAKVIENVSVTGIETTPTLLGSTEVTTVLTDAGAIKTKYSESDKLMAVGFLMSCPGIIASIFVFVQQKQIGVIAAGAL